MASPTVRMETVRTPGATGTTYGAWLELGPVVTGSEASAGMTRAAVAAPARAQARAMPRVAWVGRDMVHLPHASPGRGSLLILPRRSTWRWEMDARGAPPLHRATRATGYDPGDGDPGRPPRRQRDAVRGQARARAAARRRHDVPLDLRRGPAAGAAGRVAAPGAR